MHAFVRLAALTFLGLLINIATAADNSTTFPHPITLSLISPLPYQSYPAQSSLPIVFAITHAGKALQSYRHGSLTFSIYRLNEPAADFQDQDYEGLDALGLLQFFPGDSQQLPWAPDYTVEDLLEHAYGDTYYYAVSLGGSGGLNDEINVDGELTPGRYVISWIWDYQEACGELPMTNNLGHAEFEVVEATSSAAASPGDLLKSHEGCAYPVARLGVLGIEEIVGLQCTTFMPEGQLGSYEFEGNEVECAVELDPVVLDCLASLLDHVDGQGTCKASASLETASDATGKLLDGFDMGYPYPLIIEGAEGEGTSTSQATASATAADPSSTAEITGGSTETTAASSSQGAGSRLATTPWLALAAGIVFGGWAL